MRASDQIVLVEDSDVDARLMERAHNVAGLTTPMRVFRTGEAALDHILDHDSQGGMLILLDLNLPGISGFEVLERLRATERVAHHPVVVLSSSTYDKDIRNAYRRGANAYVSKPFGLAPSVALMSSIEAFWGQMASLP